MLDLAFQSIGLAFEEKAGGEVKGIKDFSVTGIAIGKGDQLNMAEVVHVLQAGVPPQERLVPLRPGPKQHSVTDLLCSERGSEPPVRQVDYRHIPLLAVQFDGAVPQRTDIQEDTDRSARSALPEDMRIHPDFVGTLFRGELEEDARKELQTLVGGGEHPGGVVREVTVAIEVKVEPLLALIPGEGHERVSVVSQPHNAAKHTWPGIHRFFAEACAALDTYLPGERREIHLAVLQVSDGGRRRRLGAHYRLPSAGKGRQHQEEGDLRA